MGRGGRAGNGAGGSAPDVCEDGLEEGAEVGEGRHRGELEHGAARMHDGAFRQRLQLDREVAPVLVHAALEQLQRERVRRVAGVVRAARGGAGPQNWARPLFEWAQRLARRARGRGTCSCVGPRARAWAHEIAYHQGG